MSALLDGLGVELPVVQAGMGGGLAGHALAAAVSEAGGLGTLGMTGGAEQMSGEIAKARALTGSPLAANLLLPFARAADWRAAANADAVVTFWGRPRRPPVPVRAWVHQCGSVGEARAAHAEGADAVIVQGVEAGGHVRGEQPALDLLERARAALPSGYPVLLAGGIATAADVRAALEAGATAAVLGTRFLMTEESRGHPGYKRRLRTAQSTVLTELFGAGWPGRHRVVANAAVERWLRGDPLWPRAVRAVNRLSAPLLSRLPGAARARLAAAQRPALPLFSPVPPTADGPENLLESGPLYAGETVARIDDVVPAGRLTRELAGG